MCEDVEDRWDVVCRKDRQDGRQCLQGVRGIKGE